MRTVVFRAPSVHTRPSAPSSLRVGYVRYDAVLPWIYTAAHPFQRRRYARGAGDGTLVLGDSNSCAVDRLCGGVEVGRDAQAGGGVGVGPYVRLPRIIARTRTHACTRPRTGIRGCAKIAGLLIQQTASRPEVCGP